MNHILVPHPFVAARLGGVPIAGTWFSSGRTIGQIRNLRALHEVLSTSKVIVCDALAAEVSTLYGRDPAIARALIQLKRDLFNERLPAQALAERVRPHLPRECDEAVGTLIDSLRGISGLEANCASTYASEVEQAYDTALRLFSEHALIHALALTNPPVHARVLQLLSGRQFPRKQRAQLCTSLGRYILRSGQKTSPLSSFGLVALGCWNDTAPDAFGDGNAFAMTSKVERRLQPRFAALDYVFLELLNSIERIDDRTPVILNASVHAEDGRYTWSRIKNDEPPESRTRGTRVAKNSSRAALVKLLSKIFGTPGPRRALALYRLREALLPAVGGDAARADELLSTAWQHGLIRPDLASGSDSVDWASTACACLKQPLRDAMSSALQQFMAAIASPDRFDHKFTATVEGHFQTILSIAGISIAVERFRPIVFEDCSLPAPAFGLPRKFLDRCEPELVALLRVIPILTGNAPLSRFRRLICRRFRERYGSGGVCRDVRDFIETCADTFDAHFGDSGQHAGDSERLRRGSEDTDRALARLRRKMFMRLAGLAKTSREIVLEAGHLDRYSRHVKTEGPRPDVSKMLFMQPVSTPEGPWLAINHIYPGASCMFSRFIPDDKVAKDKVRNYLREISEDGAFVELGGIFGFNANLHPILSDEVVDIPPFVSSGATAKSLDALRLRHRADRDDLVFEDERGQVVNVFYPGILTPLLMPRSHQVVRTLCFSSDRVDDLSDQFAHFLAPDARGAIRIPRVRLGDIVLVRRSLAIRKTDLPDPALDEFVFFEKFAAWADSNDLPRWMFSKRTAIPALHRGAGMQSPDWRSLPGKDAKPMPLDTACPMAVRIFQKNLAVGDLDVVFAEALPDPTQTCFEQGGHAVVGEFGIELTLKERA